MRHRRLGIRAVGGLLLAALLGSAPVLSQTRIETLETKAYQMVHQPAREALTLVEPMLSLRGSVELRLGTNTMVLRDNPSVIRKIEVLLEDFDHPARELELELHLLRARPAPAGSQPAENTSGLPPSLVKSLGVMARINRYRVMGATKLVAKEGEGVSYELGPKYEVRFSVGTVLLNQRLMLRDFQILERLGDLKKSLLHTHLNLKLGKTLVLGSADSSMAVAVLCDPPTPIDQNEPAEGPTDKAGLGGR